MDNKFTILIPTRNRSDTLYWSIKSCLSQDYDNLEVIVSDNFSTDNTRDVVQSFSDVRLKYFNIGASVSMSHNWEFALSKVSGGFVSILGDDDAFLPDSIVQINRLLVQHGVDAITWRQSFYRWPSNKFAKITNILAVPSGNRLYLRDAKSSLNSLLYYKMMVDELPWLYGGFVKYDKIEKVKKKGNGIFFNSRIPDIYSAVALSSLGGDYLFSTKPFSIAGHSGKSNGSAQMNPSVDVAVTNLFTEKLENIPFHSDLEFIHTHAFLLWESFLQAKSVGLISENQIFDNWKIFNIGLAECAKLGVLNVEEDKLLSIASKNSFPADVVNRKISMLRRSKLGKLEKVKAHIKFWTTYIVMDTDNCDVSNVYEASLIHARISRIGRIFFKLNNIKIFLSKANRTLT